MNDTMTKVLEAVEKVGTVISAIAGVIREIMADGRVTFDELIEKLPQIVALIRGVMAQPEPA